MKFTIQSDPVPLRVDDNGDVRIGDTRVLLDMVVHAFQEGDSAETIVQNYATLQLADVYAVVSYYLKHREQVDDYLRWRAKEGEEIRRKIEAHQGDMKGIRERLLTRRGQQDQPHAATG